MEITPTSLRNRLQYHNTGNFTWSREASPRWRNTLAGTLAKNDYVYISIDKKKYLAHRLVWYWFHDCWPVSELDHIDGDKSNNKIENLREVTRQENCQNTRAAGCHWNKRQCKWQSWITHNYKKIYLGSFASREEAKAAYDAAKLITHIFPRRN